MQVTFTKEDSREQREGKCTLHTGITCGCLPSGTGGSSRSKLSFPACATSSSEPSKAIINVGVVGIASIDTTLGLLESRVLGII